jgi:amino acid permease
MLLAEDFMIPCLNKKLLGFECLGCGGQRALSLLFHGEFVAAFKIYPAIYTLILFALFIILNLFYKFKNDEKVKIFLVVLNLTIIIVSYIYKLIN